MHAAIVGSSLRAGTMALMTAGAAMEDSLVMFWRKEGFVSDPEWIG